MINLPQKTKIISQKGNRACFEIESLYPGYGITIGNSLRRVLLSSLPGAAITQVRIKGVLHEFSTITGVLEDVVSILMNLKKLRFRLFSEDSQIAQLKISGEKEVLGSDFRLPAQVELVNKDSLIATLTSKNASLDMEIKIERGLGYVSVERRQKEKLEPGVIALDAIFTPVIRVAFNTENVRVGERTDFDKLFLEIETDGTIMPEVALKNAAQILKDHFALISDKMEKGLEEKEEKTEKETEKKAEKKGAKKEKKDLGIDEIGISERTANVLKDSRIKTLAGLISRKKESLQTIEGIGEKSIEEIEEALRKLGLGLK